MGSRRAFAECRLGWAQSRGLALSAALCWSSGARWGEGCVEREGGALGRQA